MDITERLTYGVREALVKAGLPAPAECGWEIPRQAEHGDYATNTAMTLARAARMAPKRIAEQIASHFPPLPEVERVEVAGPGFLNVFLAPAWTASHLLAIIEQGPAYGRGEAYHDARVRLEFVSANPTGPLVIVNARAAAIGDALARLLRTQGARVTTEYYVNDAGNQFEALARSFEARVRQALGDASATVPENGYPGEYLVELAQELMDPDQTYLDELAREYLGGEVRRHAPGASPREADEARRILEALAGRPRHTEILGRWAVERMVERQRRVLRDYGVEFDVWRSEQRDVRDAGLPQRVLAELDARGLLYEQDGAHWFRSTAVGEEIGEDKDRVIRRSNGELTYFAVDLAYHHYLKFGGADRVVNLFGPDHHGYVARMRAAMQALGHPADSLEILIVQLVTLLREGQPVRMSKRRGEFVLMEELLEEVGRDAARFTFLMRRHDSPLEFDLAVATRQSSENPVYYVQYAHARIRSIWKQVMEQGITVPPWGEVDLGPLTLPEERELMKRLVQFPGLVAGAARALEPHRIAYWLHELAGVFHPYYRSHRVIQADRGLTLARLALCEAVGQVLRNGLGLLGVSAPETM